jgi:hypothetical protein
MRKKNRFELFSVYQTLRDTKQNLKMGFNVLLFVHHWIVSKNYMKNVQIPSGTRIKGNRKGSQFLLGLEFLKNSKELLHDCCLNTRQYIALVPQFNGKSTSTVASGFQVSIVPFLSQVSQDSSGSKERRMLLSCKHRVLLSLHNLKHSVKTSIGLA